MEKQSEASQILVVGGSTQEDSGKKKKKTGTSLVVHG